MLAASRQAQLLSVCGGVRAGANSALRAIPFVLGLCAVCAWCALSGQKVAGALSSLASFRRSRIARGTQPPGYKAHGASAAGPVALVFLLPFGGEQRALGKGAGVGRWAMAILAGVAACFIAFKACSKSFHACASATHGRGRNAHRNQDCPFWQGVQQRAWSLAALPEGGGALQKQHLPCCKCSPGRQPVCSVFRVLRLAATAFAKQGTRCEGFEQALRPWCFARPAARCRLRRRVGLRRAHGGVWQIPQRQGAVPAA